MSSATRRAAQGALGPLLALMLLAGCGRTGDNPSDAGSSAAGKTVPTAPAVAPATAAASSPSVSTTPAPAPAPAPVPAGGVAPPTSVRPLIHQWPIPYGGARRAEMAAYSLRHYGEHTFRLSGPKVIVEHYTETAGAQEAFNTFAPDVPDAEFHELPNTCAHFLVEPNGRIDQLVALTLRCRHTTGLNWTAIGIENVGLSDQAILGDRAQLAASLRLTRWLRCRYSIALKNVIGHNESLSSPYHHDLVPAFQHQTHSDFRHADMARYRARLAQLPCPGSP